MEEGEWPVCEQTNKQTQKLNETNQMVITIIKFI